MKLFIYSDTVLRANCYLWVNTETQQALVVDPGAGSADWVRTKAEAEGVTIAGVLLTHGHPDHVWDAAAVAGDKPVFISEADRYRLDDPMSHLPAAMGVVMGQWTRPENIETIPALCLQGGGAQILPGFPVRAIPVPGHTEGSVGYLTAGILEEGEGAITVSRGCGGGGGCGCGGGGCGGGKGHGGGQGGCGCGGGGCAEERDAEAGGCGCGTDECTEDGAEPQDSGEHVGLIFLGDVLLGDSIGRTDLPGGDEKEMKSTLRMLAVSIDPATVVATGHGPLMSFEFQLQSNMMMRRALTE
ncbi:MAG: MBL fold metallo-hydrolase [Flaviflexus sp.]|nr:MBL fold metallo-hydrolase [Flaviflexus sp.]